MEHARLETKATYQAGRKLDRIIECIADTSPNMFPMVQQLMYALYCADCVQIMSYIPDNSVDVIFADPPYLLSNNGRTCHAGKAVKVNKGVWDKSNGFEKDVEFHNKWISECKRILKPAGTIWISGTNHNIFLCGYLLQKLGFHMLNDIAWYKPNAAPNLSCTVFAHSHETLLWARKDKKARHFFNYKAMKDGNFPEDKIKVPNKQMRSIWSIPTPNTWEKDFGKHPTQKPLSLLKRVVEASSKEGDVILDPFNGSGTTLIACQIIGDRNYIGIDTSKEHLELTTKRWKQLFNQTSFFETT